MTDKNIKVTEIVEKVKKYIVKYEMFENCNTLITGFSGGADSVCLLHILNRIIKDEKYDIDLVAVHVNHGIRGEQADKDMEFCRGFCEKNNIKSEFVCIDIPKMAMVSKMTEEEAGRHARYEIFEKIGKKYSAQAHKTAVAHHMNDNAETVIMNLLRGSGINGICGIQPVRDNIIRPLLCVSRLDILEYIDLNNLEYVTDSTNFENEYTRNKIRNICIPFLEEQLKTNVTQHICDTAQSVLEARQFIEDEAQSAYLNCVFFPDKELTGTQANEIHLDITAFLQYSQIIKKTVIHKLLSEISGGAKDIYRIHIEDVISLCGMQSGKKLDLAKGVKVIKRYDKLIFYKNFDLSDGVNNVSTEDFLVKIDMKKLKELKENEEYVLEINQKICCCREELVNLSKIKFKICEKLQKYEGNNYTKYFDYDRILNSSDLSVRFKKTEDRITVNKDGRTKKIKKELIDSKIPAKLRQNAAVLVDGSNVLWLLGIRRSEECLIDDDTKQVICISFILE